MSASISQTGGARLDFFNASYPFATLSADTQTIRLSCLGRDYVFAKRTIQRLSRHRGLFSIGLRIEHTEPSHPQFVIFWASLFFWDSGFQVLKRQLESLGYAIAG